MDHELYAKVKASARFCRDEKVRRKIQLFLEVMRRGNVEEACRVFGLSSTSYYYRWWQRYRESGFNIKSLYFQSRRPKQSPRRIQGHIIKKIKKYRFEYRYGPERIADALWDLHRIRVSESTVRRTIERRKWWIRKYRTKKINPHRKRYSLPYPGHLQMDIKYVPDRPIGRRWFVYNAIDDCSRWRFAKAYQEISAQNAVNFVNELVKAAPFKILSIQTDNDVAFTNRLNPHWEFESVHPLDEAMGELGIKHRLIPPGAKELNGKVERSHRTDEDEFYWKAPRNDFEMFQEDLNRWIYAYNHYRRHGSLGKQTPIEVLVEKTVAPILALALKWGSLELLEARRSIKQTFLDTYFIYLEWIRADPFHSLDVLNFYTLVKLEFLTLTG